MYYIPVASIAEMPTYVQAEPPLTLESNDPDWERLHNAVSGNVLYAVEKDFAHPEYRLKNRLRVLLFCSGAYTLDDIDIVTKETERFINKLLKQEKRQVGQFT